MKGVFGGNFDPVHIGHLIPAIDAINILNLEKVLLIPAWISPFKEDIETTSFKHRLEMLRLAIEGKPFFEVLDIEGRRKGISYTYDTVKELREREGDVCLLIGEDQAEGFNRWRRWREVVKMVDVYVLRRKRTPKDYLPGLRPLRSKLIETSSTDIREAIRNGELLDYYIPDRVLLYIKEHGLYR